MTVTVLIHNTPSWINFVLDSVDKRHADMLLYESHSLSDYVSQRLMNLYQSQLRFQSNNDIVIEFPSNEIYMQFLLEWS